MTASAGARFARIAVNIPRVQGVFDYHLPPSLAGQVTPGCLVEVPFGKQAVQGIVLALTEESDVPETRPVTALLDPDPALTPAQLALARWLSDETLAPLAACLEVMLPPGLAQQADTLYQINPDPRLHTRAENLPPLHKRLLALLEKRGDLRGRQIEAALPHLDARQAAQALTRRGFLNARPVLPPPAVRPRIVRTVQLACSPAEIETARDRIARKGSAAFTRRKAILDFLIGEALPVDVTWAYAAAGGGTIADLEKLAAEGLVILSEAEAWRDPLERLDAAPDAPPELTPAQSAAWCQLGAALQSAAQGQPAAPILLYGVTGSGKTELYLRAVEETLRLGRQAIILVPEIALTPQAVRRFSARFPGQVGLVHSRLSPGERYDTWRRARAGKLKVIVGPRSALFTPLPNPGLIVLDECHDDSYYQDEIPPYYSALTAAAEYGRLNHAVVLMGSATPGIAHMYHASRNGWQIFSLPERIRAHGAAAAAHLGLAAQPASAGQSLDLPPVQIVDMREELKSGNRSIFSHALQTALNRVLDAGQQAILFLNRRGSATYIFCRACGLALHCPRCDIPLTLHLGEGSGRLLCHHCNYTRQVPKKCPACGSASIRQYGMGTEKVESDLRDLLPRARILRWDAETARQKGAHEMILAHFSHHQADFLVGTQMLAKGLDLPLVTLVGVVLAEVGLNLPDYRAGERTFQLLTQVAGRAGRSPLGGQVVLQTFQPEHYAIQAASRHDYRQFYQQELAYRRKMGYPPFSRLLRLEFRSLREEEAARSAKSAAAQLSHWIEQEERTSTSLIGPVPCFFARQGNIYRWQIIVRGPDPAGFIRAHRAALPQQDMTIQVDPPGIL